MMPVPPLERFEHDQLWEAKTKAEWDKVVARILNARGGKYPPSWDLVSYFLRNY